MALLKNKSLRFQLLILLLIILIVPVLLMLYNFLYASRSDEIVLKEKQQRLVSTVETISSNLEDIKKPVTGDKLVDAYTREVKPFISQKEAARSGLYLTETENIYLEGFLHESRELSKNEQIQRKKRVSQEVSAGIKATLSAQETITRVGRTWDDQFLECLTPVIINDDIVAVVWAEERMHPIFAKSFHFRQITQYATIAVFIISILGLFFVLFNITKYISRLKTGLEVLEKNNNFRFENMPGEIGQIAVAINKMADGLDEKEKLREQLQKADFLATMGRLVTGIAHELRNPLGIINATVEVMEDDLSDCRDVDKYAKKIKQQIDRQSKTVNELLEFGRPDDNDSFHPVDVNDLISSVINFCTPLIKQQSIQLNYQLTGYPIIVSGNSEKLKQVFLNLVVNAVQAMDKGDRLNIITDTEDEQTKITFRDNGHGISQENLSYIFEPFYTTKSTGSGLGLAISQQIVRVHGGNIIAYSTFGKGTDMVIYLPLKKGV